MSLYQLQDFDSHEQVIFCHDPKSNLKAIIAIHNTNRGPALGGCRFWNYDNDDDAIVDALRLSKGMSYKAALANLDLGGGKAVIIGDSKTEKTEETLIAFARHVERLNGAYITAEDVGITVADMELVHKHTDHVVGLSKNGGSGDPSIFTALGVFKGIQACQKFKKGNADLSGLHFVVQGAGNVGQHLMQHIHGAGGTITVCDIDSEKTQHVAQKFDATIVDPDSIYSAEGDFFVPCALGAVINDETIPQLKVNTVCGAANNQLAEPRHADALADKGILYAPDFLINAGGLVNVYFEYQGAYDHDWATEKTEGIFETLLEVLDIAKSQGILPVSAAEALAERRIKKGTGFFSPKRSESA